MPRALIDEKDISALYQHPDLKKRRAVLRDTVNKLATESARQAYHKKAAENHLKWGAAHAHGMPQVRVIRGDWGDVTQALSKANGCVYAVLNMANAYSPGGGYLHGMVAQEENMFRRTDCHFNIANDVMDGSQSHYTKEETDLINGVNGVVYLDVMNPRVCIKGCEAPGVSGYQDLDENDYFLFYELKSAADDLRGGGHFNEASMRKKIRAQLDTLRINHVRSVVLSAFGCGAFGNPPALVARLYREELDERLGDFDDVVFAVYHAGYGTDNYLPFYDELNGLPLSAMQVDFKAAALKELLRTIQDNVNSKVWDERGVAYPFFDVRKTPKGIVQIRELLDSTMDDLAKLHQLKALAKYRLEHPPLFTKRDDHVRDLYQNILRLTFNELDDIIIDSFKLNDSPMREELSPR